MKIIPYQEKYYPALVAILKRNIPQYFAPSEINDFKNYLAQETEDYFVILNDNRIIGAGGINYTKNHAVLSWDFLHPDHHGKGCGSKLVTYRLQWIKDNTPYKKVVVRTSQFTCDFYAKMGFELVKKQPDFWAKGYDLYEMEMKLE